MKNSCLTNIMPLLLKKNLSQLLICTITSILELKPLQTISDILESLAPTFPAFELTNSESNSLGGTHFIFTKYITHWSPLNPVLDEK